MSKSNRIFTRKLLSFLTLALFLTSQNFLCGYVYAATAAPTTEFKHKPLKYFVPGKRILLTSTVTDKNGVELVRCYFRAQGEADFVFVQMEQTKPEVFNCVLPAASETTEAIEYLFLSVNKEKQVVKTQIFTTLQKKDKETPAWQQAGADGNISVSTELAKAPSELAGFSDSITMNVVESTARFGVVAGGLYAATTASSGGTTAVAAGTVSASAGLSTAAIVGVAVAAGGLGTAAAVSGGGSGGSDDDTSPSTPPLSCNLTTTNGNDSAETNIHELGQSSGTFNFTYDAYSVKDRFIVTYEGKELIDTGCISSGTTVPLSYSGTATHITVKVIPNCASTSGTSWNYTVSCP